MLKKLAPIALIFASSAAFAGAECYRGDQVDFAATAATKPPSGSIRITAAQWYAQPKEIRFNLSPAVVVVGLNQTGTACNESPTLNGELALSGRMFLPFGELYDLYAHAVQEKRVDDLKLLNAQALPVDKSLGAVGKLFGMSPPLSSGGWDTAEVMARVFRIEPQPTHTLLVRLFKAMGGTISKECVAVRVSDQSAARFMFQTFGELGAKDFWPKTGQQAGQHFMYLSDCGQPPEPEI